jgi:uncharacterized protein YbjT (DUF2867 family)
VVAVIVVTGGTMQFGRLVAEQLLDHLPAGEVRCHHLAGS